MGFIKHALIGIAIYKAVEYLSKKDEFGVTKFDQIKDELQEKGPEWIARMKEMKEEVLEERMPREI